MQFVIVIIVAALTFGVCFLFDKGFVALFRNKVQHRSGLAVRVNKRYAVFGLLLFLLGLAAIFSGLKGEAIMLWGGALVLLVGVGLIVYYMTFGVFYDDDSFILTTFGRKSTTYRFADIKEQRLYAVQGGNVVIELHMTDDRAVSLQGGMEGTYPFLDHAFAAWCRQTGRKPEECGFHDPSRSLWFPSGEET